AGGPVAPGAGHRVGGEHAGIPGRIRRGGHRLPGRSRADLAAAAGLAHIDGIALAYARASDRRVTEPEEPEMIERSLFSEEHEMFRDSVRRFLHKEIAPHHEHWEDQGFVDRDAWTKAGAQGLLCATMPEEYGGA